MKNSVYILFLLIFLTGCSRDDPYIEVEPTNVMWVPSNFPALQENLDNPMTNARVSLGEKLFFDKRLSGNNQVSCATCHIPSLSFSEGSVLSTKGISGKQLVRHVPVLINLAWSNNGLFWDGGSKNLESQAFAPLAHKDEMFQDLGELEEELKEDPFYAELFQEAFQEQLSANLVMKALAQFQRSLVSANSKYDYMVRGEIKVEFTTKEWEGLEIFEQKCAQCHQSDLFTDNNYHNNGLDARFDDFSEEEMYLGRYRVTRNPQDIGKYKTPSLRNIEVSAPYMHDGRFGSLESVLDFYDNGVQDSETLDPILKQNNRLGIELSKEEKDALLAFMNTLTDENYLNDERFAEY